VYHYLRETPTGKARLHLRLEPDGSGLLLVNASRVLPPQPQRGLYGLSEPGRHPEAGSYRPHPPLPRLASGRRADYSALCEQLDVMTHPDEHCAVCELDLETTAPFSPGPRRPTAWTWR
jgi:hypothetical protein